MKGYFVFNGYMGLVEDGYMLFASEEDYLDYMENQPIFLYTVDMKADEIRHSCMGGFTDGETVGKKKLK